MTKKTVQRHGFRTGESIVYPAHGVGKIVDIEVQVVAGMEMELFVINFPKDKMTLRVPVAKAASVGMRKLADETTVGKAFSTVRGRARVKRTAALLQVHVWGTPRQQLCPQVRSSSLLVAAG